jgi:DNA-directed RNA polymerase specialized sigma24 family protein
MTPPVQNEKARLKDEFSRQVSDLISPHNFKGSSLYAFIKKRAKIWNAGHLDAYEIIVEGVRRGIEHIEKKGEPIRKPEGFLRIVCLNILRDEVDKMIREEKETERRGKELGDAYRISSYQPDLMDHLEYADKALRSLPSKDRELIKLRFFEGKTYEQIQHYYELQGEAVSIPALRRRGSRALKHLRAKFFVNCKPIDPAD